MDNLLFIMILVVMLIVGSICIWKFMDKVNKKERGAGYFFAVVFIVIAVIVVFASEQLYLK